MSEVHGPLVRLIAIFARKVRDHRKAAGDDCSLRASQRREIRLRDGSTKVVTCERTSANQNVDAIPIALDNHGLCVNGQSRSEGDKRE